MQSGGFGGLPFRQNGRHGAGHVVEAGAKACLEGPEMVRALLCTALLALQVITL